MISWNKHLFFYLWISPSLYSDLMQTSILCWTNSHTPEMCSVQLDGILFNSTSNFCECDVDVEYLKLLQIVESSLQCNQNERVLVALGGQRVTNVHLIHFVLCLLEQCILVLCFVLHHVQR